MAKPEAGRGCLSCACPSAKAPHTPTPSNTPVLPPRFFHPRTHSPTHTHTLWLQVENWESAAAADAGTTYPGTEAFEAQFGSGAPLGAPLLVFRVDEGLKEGLAGGYQRGGKPDEEDEDDG